MKKVNDKRANDVKLTIIPGVGKSLATESWNIGVKSIADWKRQNPNKLYDLSNVYAERFKTGASLWRFQVCCLLRRHTLTDKHETEKREMVE